MRVMRLRFLAWRMRRRPTNCEWHDCSNPLPTRPVQRVFCSEACADAAFWQSQI